MTIAIIIHVNTEVLTTVLVKRSDNKNSTSSYTDRVIVNKLIIDTRIEILYFRQTRVSSTIKRLSIDARIKKTRTILKEIEAVNSRPLIYVGEDITLKLTSCFLFTLRKF